jgi:stage 0 sporulation protein B (sporulation initiation phosphotransferase)
MDTDRTVALIRKMRHDFSNHLQVISGYLELNHPEKAQQYVTRLILDSRDERAVFEIDKGDVILYLFEQLLNARDYGIKISYKNIDLSSVEPLMNRNEPLNTLIKMKENDPVAELAVDVVIGTNLEQDIYIDYYTDMIADSPRRLLIRK